MTVSQRACNVAARLLASDNVKNARSMYEDVVKRVPTSDCAEQGLGAVRAKESEMSARTQPSSCPGGKRGL